MATSALKTLRPKRDCKQVMIEPPLDEIIVCPSRRGAIPR
jgi:hypothetical protein